MYVQIPPTNWRKNNWNLVFHTELFFFFFHGISTNRKQSYTIELSLREHQTTNVVTVVRQQSVWICRNRRPETFMMVWK